MENKEDILKKLQSIYNALNTLEVKGKNNCAIVAGSMNVLEELFQELSQETHTFEENDKKVN